MDTQDLGENKALLPLSSCLWDGRDVLSENKGNESPHDRGEGVRMRL